MDDETLTQILKLLESGGNNQNHNNSNLHSANNNDMQTLLLKFLLSGGLTQIMNLYNQNNNQAPTPPTPEKPRTIDLTNYQRLDWIVTAPSTTSIATKWIWSVIIKSEILSSISDWIKRRIGRTP